MLAVLILFAFIDRNRPGVTVVSTTPGLNFLALVALTAYGARRLWDWWFRVAVVLTLGPPGLIIGDIHLRHKARRTPNSRTAAVVQADR